MPPISSPCPLQAGTDTEDSHALHPMAHHAALNAVQILTPPPHPCLIGIPPCTWPPFALRGLAPTSRTPSAGSHGPNRSALDPHPHSFDTHRPALPSFVWQVGTDIEDSKCCWMVCTALEVADEQQKETIKVGGAHARTDIHTVTNRTDHTYEGVQARSQYFTARPVCFSVQKHRQATGPTFLGTH